MVKFVPVSDVERPKAAQNLLSSANEKHRKFDNPHTVSKTVDRGWQQGTVGWGVLGAFGNSDKDDAAQVIKHGEGANKMTKNEKGLWVKAKGASAGKLENLSSSRGRGNGVSVYDSLGTASSSSYEKICPDNDDTRFRSEEGRFQDCSDDIDHKFFGSGGRRDRSRSRSAYSDRSRERRHSRSRSNHRERRDSDRHRSLHSRKSKRANCKSSSRSRSPSRSLSSYYHDRKKELSSRCEDRDRSRTDFDGSRRRHRSRSPRSRDRRSRGNFTGDRNSNISINSMDVRSHDRTSEPNDRRSNQGSRSHDREGERQKCIDLGIKPDQPVQDNDSDTQFFHFTATQLANRFLEVFSGVGFDVPRQGKISNQDTNHDDTNQDEDESGISRDMRLNSIASLFSEEAAILSLKSGKLLLQGKSSIRDSFARTSPDDSRCSYRVVVNIPMNSLESSAGATVEPQSTEFVAGGGEGGVSYCLDLYAPSSSPGLGDRAKDTALLYRCEGSLLTHIWGAVDPDKLCSSSLSAVSVTRERLLKSKCWLWAEAIILSDCPSLTDRVHDPDAVIFYDYNSIETWG